MAREVIRLSDVTGRAEVVPLVCNEITRMLLQMQAENRANFLILGRKFEFNSHNSLSGHGKQDVWHGENHTMCSGSCNRQKTVNRKLNIKLL